MSKMRPGSNAFVGFTWPEPEPSSASCCLIFMLVAEENQQKNDYMMRALYRFPDGT